MARFAHAYIVAGMAYGDEGKGLTTDYLTRRHRAGLVVRYNGGPQAAHNVIAMNNGLHVHHVFSQFGSGSLAGAATHLSRFMLIDPIALRAEMEILQEKISSVPLISIDPRCVIVTPDHRYANRARETARGDARHGSVGLGVGEARGDSLTGLSLTVADVLAGSEHAESILDRIRLRKAEEGVGYHSADRAESEWLAGLYARILSRIRVCGLREAVAAHGGSERSIVFEGAQGVLLDEKYGIPPHHTWSDCTFRNADTLLDEIGWEETDRTRIGVFRSYFTRHGAGPFATEDAAINLPDHNREHPWAGRFRQGHFDLRLATFACGVAHPDELMVTHMDYAERMSAEDLPEILERECGIPITLTSWGPTAADVRERNSGETSMGLPCLSAVCG